MPLLTLLFFSLVSFVTNKAITHPNARINKRLPFIKFKFLQFSPHIKFHIRNKEIHLHHWLNYSIVLIISITLGGGLLETYAAKGFLLGGIAQGVTYSDWKSVIKTKK